MSHSPATVHHEYPYLSAGAAVMTWVFNLLAKHSEAITNIDLYLLQPLARLATIASGTVAVVLFCLTVYEKFLKKK